jgi:hypothetical protein
LCLEEPENGIHPSRITAIVDLLQSIAVNLEAPVSEDNPLRQVIINTHSPLVVQAVPEESLLFAQLQELQRDGRRFKGITFSALEDTWRTKLTRRTITKGALINYLGVLPQPAQADGRSRAKRVADRADVQQLRLLFEPSDG